MHTSFLQNLPRPYLRGSLGRPIFCPACLCMATPQPGIISISISPFWGDDVLAASLREGLFFYMWFVGRGPKPLFFFSLMFAVKEKVQKQFLDALLDEEFGMSTYKNCRPSFFSQPEEKSSVHLQRFVLLDFYIQSL